MIATLASNAWSSLGQLWVEERRANDHRKATLLEDNRGAVMLIGLFMATFLIGSMWFMKGVGDAMVFKDRMQEGADHAVFSTSAVDARGMNLIAVINLIMFVLVIIHVVLAVLKWTAFACSLAVVTAEVCLPAYKFLKTAENLYDSTVIDIGLPALSIAGTAAAIGYPWYGSYAGFNVGSDYKAMAVSAGASNIPGFSFSLPLGKLFGGGQAPAGGNLDMSGQLNSQPAAQSAGASFSSDLKLGLPVILVPNKKLCDRAVKYVADLAGPFGWLLKFLGSLTNDCSGGVWDQKMFGWKKMYGAASNGNDWMQNWSFTFPNKYDENNAEAKVALAAGTKTGVPMAQGLQGKNPATSMYFAQGEFYYDCDKGWSDDACNGNDNAVFNMRWRARMRRVASPDFFGMIMGMVGQNLLGPLIDFAGKSITNAIKDTSIVKDATKALTDAGTAIGAAGPAKGIISGILSPIESAATKALKDPINKAIGSPMGSPAPGVLH